MNQTNAHKPGYKHTPLGWIPDDWEIKQLGDIGKPYIGLTYSPEDVTDKNNGILVLRSSNIQGSKLHFEDNVFVKCEVPDRAKVQAGDILICVRNGSRSLIGKSVMIDERCSGMAFGAFMSIYRSEYNGFMNQVFNSGLFKQEIHKNLGATINQITSNDLNKFYVPFPSTKERTQIANILTIWDEAIQKTQQLIERLKQRNKGLSQQLLKPKPAWKELKLSDIFERVTRKNTEANTNVVTISAQKGFIRQGDFFNKQVASEILDNYFLVEKGEFCYNKSYSNGYDWGATKRLNDFEKAVVTTLYICFRLKDDTKHSGDFFEYFFESGLLEVGLSKIAHEGGRAHGLLNVTAHDFFSLKVSIPVLTEQTRIYNMLQTASNELKLYQQQLANLQQQKKGLMQKLLSGEVRVNECRKY